MRISDWSSDVCSSDLAGPGRGDGCGSAQDRPCPLLRRAHAAADARPGSRTRQRRVLAHGARRRRLLKIWPRRPTPGTHEQAQNNRRETMLGTMKERKSVVKGKGG